MVGDFILGRAVATFGGVLPLMGVPSSFHTRFPPLLLKPLHKNSCVLRSVVAVMAGLPILFAGLAMVWPAKTGVRILLFWCRFSRSLVGCPRAAHDYTPPRFSKTNGTIP